MDRKTDNGDSCKHSVSLDADNCLSLASILEAFNGPINEEQAWALCYQTAKCIQSVHQKYQLYSISDAKYMFVHKDGSVHEKTITFTGRLCTVYTNIK
ncbi:protein spire-like protein [Leptotrombidium deliense]|uniref:Protein spire-like protein n=1 Tax=Leptotrombidium deliense TaxID=299467 RepID=A0A443SRT2_9ACAR|nr:protein spire-like protein [Leptotrombidium deliense]